MDSILDHDQSDEFESVPLPNQLPDLSTLNTSISSPERHPYPHKTFDKPVERNYERLSHRINEAQVSDSYYPQQEASSSKSRTVQTLISQNQDIMARLTVALKRNIELEQKIESQEEHYDSLASQYDILKDQSAVNAEKNKRLEFDNQKLYEQSSALEKRFAELYSSYQDKINYIQKLSYRLHRFIQYRKRIRAFVRPLISNLKAEIVDLKNQILVLNEQGIKQLEYIGDLKKRLSDSIDRIQTINHQNEKTQMDLTQYHETRYQGVSRELEVLKIETEALRTQNIDLKKSLEKLQENEASLSNKSIFFERKYTDLKNEFELVSQEFIQQKTADNTKLTNLEIQLRDTSTQLAKISQIKAELQSENSQMSDQLSSLHLIYQDNLTKIDELTKRTAAQDQINKDLSQSLVDSRKKNEYFEQKLIQTEEEFKRKLQAFQVRFNKAPQETTLSSQAIQATEQTKAGQKDLLNKIQNLLSEIQTGHTQISSAGFKEEQGETSNESRKQSSELISEYGDIENKI